MFVLPPVIKVHFVTGQVVMDEHTLQSLLQTSDEVQVELGFQKCAVGKLLDSFRAFCEFTSRQHRFFLFVSSSLVVRTAPPSAH